MAGIPAAGCSQFLWRIPEFPDDESRRNNASAYSVVSKGCLSFSYKCIFRKTFRIVCLLSVVILGLPLGSGGLLYHWCLMGGNFLGQRIDRCQQIVELLVIKFWMILTLNNRLSRSYNDSNTVYSTEYCMMNLQGRGHVYTSESAQVEKRPTGPLPSTTGR